MIDKQTTLWGYNHEEGGDDYIYWTKHSYNFIGREDVVLTDGQPTTGDDEDNGLFDTAKNIYGVFDDTRFRNTSYTTILKSKQVAIPDISQEWTSLSA